MPKIDRKALEQLVSMVEVLRLIGFTNIRTAPSNFRMPCPFHCSKDRLACSVSLKRKWFHCFRCKRKGDPISLYLQMTRLEFFRGCLDLCRKLGVIPPYEAEARCEVDERGYPVRNPLEKRQGEEVE